MSRVNIAAWIAFFPLAALAAPTWQVISSDQSKRIEIDRTSIKREDGNKVTALGRVVLEKEIVDAKSGSPYKVIEATTRYDCAARSAATLRRVFKKNESEVLRDEEQKPTDLPVRSGTLDDKVLREVCRPAKADAREVAQKANEAAGQLKQANEALVKKEVAKAEKGALPKKIAITPEHPPADPVEPRAAKPAPAAKAPVVQPHATGWMVAVREKKAPAPDHGHATPHWSYEGEGGPENWHRLDPKNVLCATGQRQSPIDIRDGIRVDLEAIKFDYKPSAFRIVDNGHTVQVTPYGGTITVGGKTYELVQFHFHKPAEEKVNGRSFDMVAHLVHRSDEGKLAVVAVLLEKGAEHPVIQTLWNNLPLERNVESSVPQSIDLMALLPENRNYYTYMGSLTTPPCTEGVLWLVLKQPVPVSSEQVAIFARLHRHNARPVQPPAGRLIKDGR